MEKSVTTVKNPGALLAVSGIVVFLGIQTAEMNYIGEYSTGRNYISDLGVNDSSSSLIFNLTMIIAGILIIISSNRFKKSSYSRKFYIPLFLYGLGTAGVGLFPWIPVVSAHGLSASILFVTGPIAAIISQKYMRRPLKTLSVTLGIISLFFLVNFVFAVTSNDYMNNIGGIERWVVYPITVWLIVFGSVISTKDVL